VDLNVMRGDIFGYLGPNGAGKTTTIRIILGLFPVTSGKAAVLGQDARVDAVRRKIGFVLEADGLYDNMTAVDNLTYYAQLYDAPQPAGSIDRALNLVGLSGRSHDKVGTYSKGMRQRLALARAMVHEPDLLILDEPTSGVDPSGQIEIRQVLLDMARNEGKTILLSSHNLDEVQRICNRVALIHQGQIRLSGELDKLQHEMGRGEVIIETAEPVPSSVLAGLKEMSGIDIRDQQQNILKLSASDGMDISGIVTRLAVAGVRIEQIRKQEASLEEIYTTILKETGPK